MLNDTKTVFVLSFWIMAAGLMATLILSGEDKAFMFVLAGVAWLGGMLTQILYERFLDYLEVKKAEERFNSYADGHLN